MNGHPGGEEHTRRMLSLAGIEPGASVLDMGAGAGETVRLLRAMGYECEGIDIAPRGEGVSQGDMLRLPFPDGSFDAVISQCAFYVSADVKTALAEAFRVLRHAGALMLSDVWFGDAGRMLTEAGFRILHREDMTPLWREYYIEALWRGEECCVVRGKCTYEMLIGIKE